MDELVPSAEDVGSGVVVDEDGISLDPAPSVVDIDSMMDERLLSVPVPVMVKESYCVDEGVSEVERVSL